MLIARITGGIGNQLFQYAFIRSLSLKLNVKYKLDLSWYRDYEKYENTHNPNAATKREYLLDKFNINEKLLSPSYLRASYKINNSSLLNTCKNIFPLNYFSYNTITEQTFDIDDIKSHKNTYLSGFWQKSDLFEEYNALLKKEFILTNSLNKENQYFMDNISASNSVSVHIRRGDLLSRPAAVRYQPYSSNKYFSDSIDIIKNDVSDPNLFVFSDDINWVKKNFNFDIPYTYIDNDGPDYEHFSLMCNCKHQVIANSTFSWWAAWMNNYPNKIIIAPKWWYRDPVKNESIIRIPDNWIIIENLN